MRHFHFDFYWFFFDFSDRIFVNGFLNQFTVDSRPIFFYLKEISFSHFSSVVFVHMRHFDIDLFLIFYLSFLELVFSIHSKSGSRSSFLFNQWEFFELYARTCPAMFFVSSSDALFRFTSVHTAKLKRSNFLSDFFLSLTAFAWVTSFLTLFSQSIFAWLDFDHKWLTSLKKNDFCTLKLKFNLNLFKVKGTHMCRKGP